MTRIPVPINEPVLSYAPGTAERAELKRQVAELSERQIEIPVIIGGRAVETGRLTDVVMPHRHRHVLARVHQAGPQEVAQAITACAEARRDWSAWSLERRAAVFLRAADLLATRRRALVNAGTMLGQSKTAHQAEIDAACELIDFWRFNAHFAERLEAEQPRSAPGTWNQVEYRPLEGFVYAVTPFNFTSIGGNLPAAPALMGCTVVWKPSMAAVYSNYYVYKLLEEAGLPPGVINFVPGPPEEVTRAVLASPTFGGLHFTGSTDVFRGLWSLIAQGLATYRDYPRIVGETGGKDFVVAHASADIESLATALVRGAYEYQGQKCSAVSRAYIPDTVWPSLRERLGGMVGRVRMGDPADFRNFMGAVIHRQAFAKITGYVAAARAEGSTRIVFGGGADDAEGWFVEPTVLQTTDPRAPTMQEEIFGPVLTVYVYPAGQWAEVLSLVDQTSPYALTGAVFAEDRRAAEQARVALRYAAGNFYINDKPTGAVVGQQPFGGARASGTNDKAGSVLNLVRWVSPRTVKETFVPPRDFPYPFMGDA